MDKHYYDYLKLLKTLWSDSMQGKCQSIFFITRKNEAFNEFINRIIPHFSPVPRVFQAWIHAETFSPYYPFLSWIEAELKPKSKKQIQNILNKAGVYYFHIEILLSYFLSTKAERHEMILDDELSYEQDRMQKSIWDLFLYLFGNEHSIIILENLHYIPSSTFELLDRFIMKSSDLPFLFIFSINQESRKSGLQEDAYWSRMYDVIQGKSVILDFIDTMSQAEYKPVLTPTMDIKTKILLSENAYQLLALKDCQALIQSVYKEHYQAGLDLDLEHKCRMLRLMGDVNYRLSELDQSYINYHALLNTAQQHSLTDMIIYAYQRIGFIHLKKEDLETAEKMSQQSLKLANEIGDEKSVFYSLKLNFLIEDKGRRQDIQNWKKLFYQIIELAQKLNMDNSLASFATNPFGQYSRMDENIEKIHKMGAEIARKYGNEFRLASAYQTMGLVQAVKGNYSNVIKLYKKSKKLKSRLRNPLEMSYVHNGLGYYYFMTGKYKLADKNFHIALTLLKQVKDYHEIAMTFFNLAYTYFFSFRFDWAIDYLEKTLYLMEVLHLKNLAYHSLFGIYALLGASYCKSGQFPKAYEYWTRIQVMQLSPYTAKNEEYFMFYMLNAYLKSYEGHAGLAIFYFNGAEHYLNKQNDIIKYMAPYFYYEYGNFLKTQDMAEKSESMYDAGLTNARELGNEMYQRLISDPEARQVSDVSPFFQKPRSIDFEWIIESAKMQNTLIVLHKKYDEIHFLNSFQTLMSQYEGHDLLIQKAIDHIHNSFLVDSVFFHIYQSGQWVELYSRHSSQPLLEENAQDLLKYLTQENTNQYIPDISQDEKLISMKLWVTSIMSFPLVSGSKWHGHILCLTNKDNDKINQEDMEVLSLAIKQLLTALEKLDQKRQIILSMQKLNALNKRLQQAAVTDILTKLKNRSAFMEKIGQEIARINRYGDSARSVFSLIFIDLDNFKYYNDTFGHHIGDMLLVKFGSILESAARDIDFVARYGGDEFVCILPETQGEGAIALAKRIYEFLEYNQYFKKDIEEYVGHPISIPDNKLLNCTIGISVYHPDTAGSSEEILKQADHAMYDAKRKGKGSYSVYNFSRH